jgi:MarR family transcriptional regulator, organic hydroperoxide resistance regulator
MTKAPAEPDYPLGPALEFLQKLWQLNHALERVSGHMMTTLGVTAQQRLMVRCLGRYPGLSAGALASLLHLDPGTVSATLRRLEAKGLVERRRDPRDSRRAALGLTAKGRSLDRSTKGTVESAVEQLLESVPPADLAATERTLADLTSRLEAGLGR